MTMINFLHTFNPQPIFLDLGPISIRYYGLLICVGLILALILVEHLARLKKINLDVYELGFVLALFGILGARLYEVVIINWSYYAQDLLSIYKIWQGGLAIHGAVIAGLLVLLFYSRKYHLQFWSLTDIIAPALALGQAIGRWGNYFNQELYGRPTDVAWSIPIQPANRLPGYEQFMYYHPTFLYESLMNLGLFILLFILVKKVKQPGIVTLVYLAGYMMIRFITEYVRIDPTPQILGFRLPQLAGVIIFGFVLGIYLSNFKQKKTV